MDQRPALRPWAILAWTVGIAALLAAVWFAISGSTDRLLVRTSEQTALKYAQAIAEHAPELPLLFEGRPVSRETLAELRRLRLMGDVFRFKFFGPDGHLLMTSDHLDAPEPLAAAAADNARTLTSHHGGNETVRNIVLGGRNHIEIKSGAGKSNRPPLYTEAYVPMVVGGAVIGVVEVYVDSTATAARIQRAFVEVAAIVGGTLLLMALAGFAWWVRREAEKRRSDQRVRYLASHDALSGTLNRASFHDALHAAAARRAAGGPTFAVLCVDLDHFKDVNDAHGHAGGDAVLAETARRLQALVRHGDVVARLGGDEFALIQSAPGGSDDVQALAERIVASLAQPHEVSGHRVLCGASVGAACFGIDATDVDELLHRADVAMYRAKSSGRGRFSFYDSHLDRELEERRRLALDLRQAASSPGLAAGEVGLSMHYQALHGADGSTLLGYEALMRWKHPTRGDVPPSVFIPLAEDTGQIELLGRWALECACAEAAQWPAPLTVSVNLSAAQFRGQFDLVEVVTRAVNRAGLAPERLVLEITESLLMADTDSVVRTLTQLSELGVGIAMDDFGTGYSSLAYLWRFPFDKLKIDRAFTQGLANDQKAALIVRSIVTLAHSMGIRVNAEGVETPRQMQILQAMGCDELQGFLLGRPSPGAALTHKGAANELPSAPRRSETQFGELIDG